MHEADFLQNLAMVMMVAGLVTVLFRLAKQPVVLGYILAGWLLGPQTPLPVHLIEDEEIIRTLGEIGIVFLLFSLGLEFNLRKIRQIGPTVFLVAPLETGIMFFLGLQLGRLMGWETMDCVYLGAIMMISSTTIITKTLTEMRLQKEKFSEVIFGILIAEDIIAILMIAALSGVGLTGEFAITPLVSTIGKLGAFLITLLVVGLLVAPRLLDYIGRFKSEETLLIAALGLCFGVSLLAIKLEYSVALGAFIIGAVIAESQEIHLIERLIGPIRIMFSAVFFTAIGLLIDPMQIWEHIGPVILISVAIMTGKFIFCSFGSFIGGYDQRTSLKVGAGMSQIGEFSFIIAALGMEMGVINDHVYPIAVAVSAITSTCTPYWIRLSDRIVETHAKIAPKLWLNYLNTYSEWIQRVGSRKKNSAVRKMIRTIMIQLLINMSLVSGIFLFGAILYRNGIAWMKWLPESMGGAGATLFGFCLLLALPVMIAFFRKLQAFGMILSELATPRKAQRSVKIAAKAIIANTVIFTGGLMLIMLIMLLSTAFLPPAEILITLALLVIGVGFLLRRFFIRIYAKAQISLKETLTKEKKLHGMESHLQPPQPAPAPRPELPFDHAAIQTFLIASLNPFIGKAIKDTHLRSKTGCSVIAVRRANKTELSPSPDWILEPDDQVMLLGSETQLTQGRKWLETADL